MHLCLDVVLIEKWMDLWISIYHPERDTGIFLYILFSDKQATKNILNYFGWFSIFFSVKSRRRFWTWWWLRWPFYLWRQIRRWKFQIGSSWSRLGWHGQYWTQHQWLSILYYGMLKFKIIFRDLFWYYLFVSIV